MKQAGAFFLSPFPAAMLGGMVSWATGGFPRLVPVIVFYLLLLYAAQLVFGIPIRALLLKKGRTSAASFGMGGALMVALPTVPYLAWAVAKRPDSFANGLAVFTLWLICGAVAGLTYWLLVRPNRVLSDSG